MGGFWNFGKSFFFASVRTRGARGASNNFYYFQSFPSDYGTVLGTVPLLNVTFSCGREMTITSTSPRMQRWNVWGRDETDLGFHFCCFFPKNQISVRG
jgi:hypothetical protein